MRRWLPQRHRLRFFRTVRGRRTTLGIAIVAGAAVAGYLLSLAVYPVPLVPKDQRVALVIGLPASEAEKELKDQGFRVKTLSTGEQDPILPAGHVTWQEPPAFVELPQGGQVDLTLSEGSPLVTVPDVIQFDVDQARRVLAAAGFAIGTADSVPTNAEAGVVVATRPATGTPRSPGSNVDLVVSRGPAAIQIPNLVGMQESEARQRLETLGLRVGFVRTERGNRVRPTTVLEQRPRAGALSTKGGRVDLTVAEPSRP